MKYSMLKSYLSDVSGSNDPYNYNISSVIQDPIYDDLLIIEYTHNTRLYGYGGKIYKYEYNEFIKKKRSENLSKLLNE